MANYNHSVSGIYRHNEDAHKALALMIDKGLQPDQMQIIESTLEAVDQSQSDKVLKEVLTDGAAGTALGAGAFGIGHIALVGANISLFVASPILGPLIMLGWGASIGGLLGAAAGAMVNLTEADGKDKQLADLIEDAIAKDSVVLVVQTMTVEETRIAQDVIRDSVKESGNITTI